MTALMDHPFLKQQARNMYTNIIASIDGISLTPEMPRPELNTHPS